MYGDGLPIIFRGVYTEYGNEKGLRGNPLNPCYLWWAILGSNQ